MCARKAGIFQRVRSTVRPSPVRGNTPFGVSVSMPTCASARLRTKLGGETYQAVMREREGIEPRQKRFLRGGRAIMRKRRQHPWGLAPWAPPGSVTTAWQEGMCRNLGDLCWVGPSSLEPRSSFVRQGLNPKAAIIPYTEVRCPHSSEEAE